jgi:hypothetical protein
VDGTWILLGLGAPGLLEGFTLQHAVYHAVLCNISPVVVSHPGSQSIIRCRRAVCPIREEPAQDGDHAEREKKPRRRSQKHHREEQPLLIDLSSEPTPGDQGHGDPCGNHAVDPIAGITPKTWKH